MPNKLKHVENARKMKQKSVEEAAQLKATMAAWKMWKCLGNLSKWFKLLLMFMLLLLFTLLLLLQFVELDKSLGNVYAKSEAKAEQNETEPN